MDASPLTQNRLAVSRSWRTRLNWSIRRRWRRRCRTRQRDVAVIFTRGERWDPDRALQAQDGLDGHVEFIRRNRELGVVIEGAPFHDPSTHVTDDLVGLALIQTDSPEYARRLIETDPVVQSGVFGYRLYPWWDAQLA